jgi:SAM-dependent methyltransferase
VAAEDIRSAAEAAGGSTRLFSRKVDDYRASRPDYPAALFDELARRCPPPAEALDIGAGTGLFSRDLLRRGWRVTAVEPDAAMRAAADAELGGEPGYRSAAGRAEALPVPDASVDLLVAAQAFHWFELGPARAECARVLRPGGLVALVWNHRADDALNRALSALLQRHGGALAAAMAAEDDLARVPDFFAPQPWTRWQAPHTQRLDAAGLAALVFSRSYMPPRGTPAAAAAEAELQALFARHAQADGRLALHYDTVACLGRLS